MIYVIDDDRAMAKCVARACGERDVRIFGDAIAAMNALNDEGVPDLIFLDVLLTGPDGFTFLNELVSYQDTAQIPVVLVTSLGNDFGDLSAYGVVGILNKEVMRPEEIRGYVEQYAA